MSNSYWEKCVNNMIAHIIADSSLKEYVINGSPPDKGFMWDRNEKIDKLAALTDSDRHSGASFAFCIRECQKRLNLWKFQKKVKNNYHNI